MTLWSAQRILRLSDLSKKQHCRRLVMSEMVNGIEKSGQLSAISRNNWHAMKVWVVAGRWPATMQKRFRPETDTHRKARLHGWLVACMRTWISGFPPFPGKNGSLGLSFVQTTWLYVANLHSFWKSGISVGARQKTAMWPVPSTKSGCGVPNMLFW